MMSELGWRELLRLFLSRLIVCSRLVLNLGCLFSIEGLGLSAGNGTSFGSSLSLLRCP
jgi:hypothetical protein